MCNVMPAGSPTDPIHRELPQGYTIGLVSDIHGNYPALEAVLAAMPEVDDLICLGDIVGYGPEPKRCLDEVRELASVVIQGNHERNLADPDRYRGHEMAFDGLTHSVEQLTDEDIEWALDLPGTVFYTDDIVLCHSHPDPNRRGSRLTDRTLSSLVPGFEQYGLELVAFGHTHEQRAGAIADYHRGPGDGPTGQFVNPGSVGQPRDGDTRAAYAVFELSTDGLAVRLDRVPYDIDRIRSLIMDHGLPEVSAERLVDGW